MKERNINNRNYPSIYFKRRKKRRIVILVCCILFLVIVEIAIKNIVIKNTNSSKNVSIGNVEKISEIKETTKKPKKELSNSPIVLPNERVEINYFNDAVFVGDSRVEGFILNNNLFDTYDYSHKGLDVNGVFSKTVINKNEKQLTVIDALKQTHFSKVYIMLGLNEMGWVYNDIFINRYENIVKEIKKINPKAIIYVQSILPVSQHVSDTHDYINNKKIKKFNELLITMAEKNNINYVNVYECMVNNQGVLPNEAAYDGIHLKKAYCEKWLEYLLTHTVKNDK